MPFGIKPSCTSCKITTTTLWRKGTNGNIYCNSCGIKQLNGTLKEPPQNPSTSISNGSKNGNQPGYSNHAGNGQGLRKSSRIKPTKKSALAASKPVTTKGKGRRIIFKKNPPMKAPTAVATVVTGESVFYKNQYYQVGDIVSLLDHDGGIYYAQLRGFLSDQYNDKSAVITWLIPTNRSPPDKFDPNTFILGPEEDLPRKLEYMEFVCHAPSDYFRAKNAPYKTFNPEPNLCYIWTSIGPRIEKTPSVDEIFGVGEFDDSLSKPMASGKGGKEKSEKKSNLVKMDIDELLTPSPSSLALSSSS